MYSRLPVQALTQFQGHSKEPLHYLWQENRSVYLNVKLFEIYIHYRGRPQDAKYRIRFRFIATCHISVKSVDKMAHSQIEVIPKKEKMYQEHQTKLCERLFCRKCVRYFASKSEFSHHVEEHIKETNDGKSSYMSYIEKYICSSCGQQFVVKSDLIIHYNTVCFDAPYTCKHCRENCENPPFLQMHLLFHHNYTEEMLRDEGFLTDIDTNALVSKYSFTKNSRCKAFKSPPPEVDLYSIEHECLSNSRLSNRKSRSIRRKRENLAFNLLDKAYTCEICSESFSRKCVLDIHAQKHVLKNTRAILKPCNVILGSTVWQKVQPKSKIKGVITSTKRGMRRSKIIETLEGKGQPSNSHNAISCPFDELSGTPAWKKIKLRSKIPNFAASGEPKVLENTKKKPKLRRKTQNVAAPKKKIDPVTPKKKNNPRSKIQNTGEQKSPKTSNIAMDSESNKVKEDKKVTLSAEKQVFICEICKKQFQDNFKLKRHFLVHTGERPYTCKKCKKTFTRDDHMKRHLKKVCSKRKNSK